MLAFFLIFCFGLGLLYVFQYRLVYFPMRYPPHQNIIFHRPIERLDYQLGKFPQTAFYVPPLGNPQSLPPHLWILFSGNAAGALSYDTFLKNLDASPDGFLLIDYPGYGFNAGTPSPTTVSASADLALAGLAEKFSISSSQLQQRFGLFGISLGSAAALQFVVDHPEVHRLIMVAPFTKLRDMARLRFGPLYLLAHPVYNNEASLKLLAARDPRPYVAIFHGDADPVIPVRMSRTLAAENPELVRYQEIKDAGHNDILDLAPGSITAAMVEADEAP